MRFMQISNILRFSKCSYIILDNVLTLQINQQLSKCVYAFLAGDIQMYTRHNLFNS